jgi:hypothetical protein
VLIGVFVPQMQLVLLVISIGFLIVGVGYLALVIRGRQNKKETPPDASFLN